MPASANEQIADAATTHSVNMLRVEADLRTSVLAELKKLEADLIHTIASLPETATAFKRSRLNALLAQTTTGIDAAYELIAQAQGASLAKIGGLEQAKTNQILNNTFQVEVATVAQTPTQLEAMVDDQIINGRVQADWWAKQSEALKGSFEEQMRDGMFKGEGIDQLVRRVIGTRDANYTDGIMKARRSQAEALVRTSVQTAANSARLRSFLKNQDIIKGVQWRATLDSRTSETCIGLDGKVWSLPDFDPVGHDLEFPGPVAHWNCRSTQTAVTRSWNELAGPKAVIPPKGSPTSIDALLKKKLKKGGMSDVQIDAALKEQRVAFDGEAADPQAFNDFLKTKSADFQNKLLGPHKAQLWREGKITLRNLIDQTGRPLTIDQLHSLIAKNEAVQSTKAKEGDNGLTLIERGLLEESLIQGTQVDRVMSHFVDQETGERISINGISPSAFDMKRVAEFSATEVLRNALSNAETWTPQEINLFGRLPNFSSARIVSPNGALTTMAQKPGREFNAAAATAVNQKAFGKKGAKPVIAALRKQSSLKITTAPAATIVPKAQAFNQSFGALSVPQPFAGPAPADVLYRSASAVVANIEEGTAKNFALALNANAIEAERVISKDVIDIAADQGGRTQSLERAVKALGSLERKITTDIKAKGIAPALAASRIADTVRYTMIFEPADFTKAAQGAINDFAARGYQILQVKDFWADPHYHGTHVIMRDPNVGLVTELQFHTPDSYLIKDSKSHALYEKYREMADSDPAKEAIGEQLAEIWKDVEVPLDAPGIHDPAGPPPAVKITSANIEAYRGTIDSTALAARKNDFAKAFKDQPGAVVVSLSKLVSAKNEIADLRYQAGLKDDPRAAAAKGMLSAIDGSGAKRAPLDVISNSDGTYTIVDGNATAQAAMLAGWDKIVVRIKSPGEL